MNVADAVFAETQAIARSLFLHHRMVRALVLAYFFVESFTLAITSAAYLSFGVELIYAFSSFLLLSAVYTFFFFMSFSYFLYNISSTRRRF